MERSATTDAVIRAAQPVNLVLLPLLIWQGGRLRTTMPRLPEADGPRTGLTSGPAPSLRLVILGDSSAAGVGVGRQDEALAGSWPRSPLSVSAARSRGDSWRAAARQRAAFSATWCRR